MVAWIALFCFLLLAAACIMVPFRTARSEAVVLTDDTHALKTALEAVDRDERLGILGPDEANRNRAGIADHFATLQKEAGDDVSDRLTRHARAPLAAALAGLFVVVGGLATYAAYGSPDYRDQPLAWRIQTDEGVKLAHAVHDLERHLSENPTDAEGWKLIAPIYFQSQNWPAAAEAYYRAARHGNHDKSETSRLLGLSSQATFNGAEGAFPEQAIEAARVAQSLDNTNPRPAFLLAMAAEQTETPELAIQKWQDVIDRFGGAHPALAATARLRVTNLQSDAQNPVPEAPRGPTREQIDTASKMSAEDQQAMITSMVEGLAQRLADQPDDLQGWERLINAYGVLGKQKEAQSAMETAKLTFENQPDALLRLNALSEKLGL